MSYILETDRLVLREFTLNDTFFIIELLNSPLWIQFIGDRNIQSKEQAINYLENGPLLSYRQHGFGLWLVEKKDDRTAVGMCGILKRESLEHPDIGFAFLPEYHGRGYAFEIASATLAYAKNKLGLPVIAAIVQPDNLQSTRLLEKIGLRFIKSFRFPGNDEELLLYSNQTKES